MDHPYVLRLAACAVVLALSGCASARPGPRGEAADPGSAGRAEMQPAIGDDSQDQVPGQVRPYSTDDNNPSLPYDTNAGGRDPQAHPHDESMRAQPQVP
jgi:hypothetical protein